MINKYSEVVNIFSIVFICPYFGKLPKGQFPLWLKSCEYNPSIDWIIFTDDKTKYNYPKNVKVIYTDYESFKLQIENKFSFKISLDEPYKLCDFRPAYGYIFQVYIKEYDYWGYGDISDTIFGNLRTFLTDENLSQADKIMYLGHMTLYKNNEEVNSRFMLKSNDGSSLEEILGSSQNKCFDEFPKYGINYIYKDNHLPIKVIDNMLMDVAPLTSNFQIWQASDDFEFYMPDNLGRCFLWKNGKLYAYKMANKKIDKQEIGYLHFQVRHMVRKVSLSTTSFMIVPNKFIPVPDNINEYIIKKYTRKNILNSPYPFYKIRCLKRKLKKIRMLFKI